MTYAWVPLLGDFETNDRTVKFLGKTIEYPQPTPTTGAAVGNVLCDQRFNAGSIEATVEFMSVNERTGCELILYYETQTKAFLSAGLGGLPWAMFDIRDFRPNLPLDSAEPVWRTHAAGGSRENLKPNRKYRVRADVVGSGVVLWIDGVEVLKANMPYVITEGHVGLWCMAEGEVIVTDYRIRALQPRAFVVMQFTSPYNELYTDVIKRVCESHGLTAIRADDIYGPGLIVGDVIQEINSANLIIADVSKENANVYFEVGYAFALNKPAILLAEKPTDLPFDIKAFRVLFYENSIAGKAKVEAGLDRHLRAILGVPTDGEPNENEETE